MARLSALKKMCAMTEEFKNYLLEGIINDCKYALPWPPRTLHDKVQYLAYAGRYLCPEYHFKWPQLDWLTSEEITGLCQDYPDEWQGYNLDRRHNLVQFMRLIKDVPGDTAECGTFEGVSSLLILRHAPAHGVPRTHHIFDSFEGISEPGEHDDCQHWRKYSHACPEDRVHKNLHAYSSRFRTWKGWIPSRFHEVADTKFAFVHIDVDLYEPTRDSIAFFYSRLNPGGIVICDDYGCRTCPGATKAMDDFLADKEEKMLPFASGGGFMIKGKKTA